MGQKQLRSLQQIGSINYHPNYGTPLWYYIYEFNSHFVIKNVF